MAKHDLRRNRRTPYSGVVELAWLDAGESRFARGRCLDLSNDGLRLELPAVMPTQTIVTLKFERVGLTGTASVRHVRRNGMKFIVGFELSQQLKQRVAAKLQPNQSLDTLLAS